MSNEADIALKLFNAVICDVELMRFGRFYVREYYHEYAISFKNKKTFKMWYKYCEENNKEAFYYGVRIENNFFWKLYCTIKRIFIFRECD